LQRAALQGAESASVWSMVSLRGIKYFAYIVRSIRKSLSVLCFDTRTAYYLLHYNQINLHVLIDERLFYTF